MKQCKGKPSNPKALLEYMKKAVKGNPKDPKIKELLDEVQAIYNK